MTHEVIPLFPTPLFVAEIQGFTKEELEFVYFMKGTSGSFMTNLFKTIMSADLENMRKLSLGFPNEVDVVHRYQNEEGYWQQLQEKIR